MKFYKDSTNVELGFSNLNSRNGNVTLPPKEFVEAWESASSL